ncbi:MAG: hypothetical protein J6X24_05785 [Firmicutes bacterium]|nr:hypothetical protein [Bacillota bacterium]
MVDLTKKPYELDAARIAWVSQTIASMTEDEKICQLFAGMGAVKEENYLKGYVSRYPVGGFRYNPGTGRDILKQNTVLQQNSKIPLLIAANAEGGGDGVCVDGTAVGLPVKIGATGDAHYAYELGRICGTEAEAVGCNWLFAPVVDISMNWRNPIVSRRCFSKDADQVLEFGKAYLKGVSEHSGCICAFKHFPGDGADERDQHLSRSVNPLSCEEWDATYGKVYRGLIDAGVESVMAGHIMLPSYSRRLNPDLPDSEILPATLSEELLTGLLRGQLGFNGLIVTDATHMVGMTCEMKRSEALPRSIAAGCDMLLFFNDPEEDLMFVKKGYEDGIITEERLNDALTRILGMKAKMGLTAPFTPAQDRLPLVHCADHMAVEREVAERSITLVKHLEDVFPVTPERYPRVLIVPAKALSAISSTPSGKVSS